MQREHRAVVGELHGVGFPMPGVGSIGEASWTLADRHSAGDAQGGATALAAAVAALGFASRQVAAPGVVLGPGDLGVDEAVDRLVADDLLAPLEGQAPGHRFGRQPSLQELDRKSVV